MNETVETLTDEVLAKRLLEQQPHLQNTLKSLYRYMERKDGGSPFAPIINGRCGACRISLAAVLQQRAKQGLFISCINCSHILYHLETSKTTEKKR